jgi:predicted ArsR family transcriptional regulator
VGTRLAHKYAPSVRSSLLQDRVSELAGTLNGNGVLADARAQDDDTILLRTYNCPFHELAHEHREICDMDINMMRKVLGSDVSLSSCMLDGHAGCTFVVKQGQPASAMNPVIPLRTMAASNGDLTSG